MWNYIYACAHYAKLSVIVSEFVYERKIENNKAFSSSCGMKTLIKKYIRDVSLWCNISFLNVCL